MNNEKQPQASIAIQCLPKVEGDFDALMGIVKECQLICIREGAPSVSSYVKIAFNPEAGVWSIDKKTTKHHQ